MAKYEWSLPLPVCLFLLGLLVPPELSINLAGIRLSGYRLILLILFLPMLFRLFARPEAKIGFPDLGLLFVSVWCAVSLLVNEPYADAIEKSGILAIEMYGAYLISRNYITNLDEFASTIKFLVFLVFVILFMSLPESVTGIHFLRVAGVEYISPRFGLHRAYGPFDHPILLGVVCASAFALTFYLFRNRETGKRWPFLLVICGATFLSLSAGPFLALAAQIGLVMWDRLFLRNPHRFRILLGVFIVIYAALSIVSDRPVINVLISKLTFSAQTAYVRLLIFDYGSAEVANHPLFGIGYGEWERPDWMPSSVDNFWLLMAMRYGLPVIAGIAAVLGYMGWRITSEKRGSLLDDLGRGWLITMSGLVLVGCTVHFWNVAFVLFFFFLGMGVWLLGSERYPHGEEIAVSDAQPAPIYRPRQTLF